MVNQVNFVSDIFLKVFIHVEQHSRKLSEQVEWVFDSKKKSKLLLDGRTKMLNVILRDYHLSFSNDLAKRVHDKIFEYVDENGRKTTQTMGKVLYSTLDDLLKTMMVADIKELDIENSVEQKIILLTKGEKCSSCSQYLRKKKVYQCIQCDEVICWNCVDLQEQKGICSSCHSISLPPPLNSLTSPTPASYFKAFLLIFFFFLPVVIIFCTLVSLVFASSSSSPSSLGTSSPPILSFCANTTVSCSVTTSSFLQSFISNAVTLSCVSPSSPPPMASPFFSFFPP